MAYCVKCGVKLEASEEKCPLCKTVVYHPDLSMEEVKPVFPPIEEVEGMKFNPKYKALIASFILFLPTALSIICDYSINGEVVWSGIVLASALLVFIIVFVPLFLPKLNIIIYLAADYLALLAFERYIESKTHSEWFYGFALPLTSSLLVIILAAVVVKRITKGQRMWIFSVLFFLSGLECVLIEFLINLSFTKKEHLIWAYYPAVTFVVVGIILLICSKNQKLKNKIEKKFFV